MAEKITPDGSLYGLDVGTRWHEARGRRTVVILWVQRSGVVVYRDEGASPDDERVISILRFVETFVPANTNMGTLGGFPNPPAMRPPKSGVAGWAVRAEIPEGEDSAGQSPAPSTRSGSS